MKMRWVSGRNLSFVEAGVPFTEDDVPDGVNFHPMKFRVVFPADVEPVAELDDAESADTGDEPEAEEE